MRDRPRVLRRRSGVETSRYALQDTGLPSVNFPELNTMRMGGADCIVHGNILGLDLLRVVKQPCDIVRRRESIRRRTVEVRTLKDPHPKVVVVKTR